MKEAFFLGDFKEIISAFPASARRKVGFQFKPAKIPKRFRELKRVSR
jgi:hypothetical protein